MQAACVALLGSTTPRAYETCVFDCCVTGDVQLCSGLAKAVDDVSEEFKEELIGDGRWRLRRGWVQ